MVDDEAHCLFRCAYSDLEDFRLDLLADCKAAVPGARMVTYADFWTVLEQITCEQLCRRLLLFVATCVRVSWRCYKAGGCDQPVLPRAILNVLPPALDLGLQSFQYIDDFDSASCSDEDLASD